MSEESGAWPAIWAFPVGAIETLDAPATVKAGEVLVTLENRCVLYDCLVVTALARQIGAGVTVKGRRPDGTLIVRFA